MKDAPVKTTPIISLPKASVKKPKVPTKKTKDTIKTPILKISKGKKKSTKSPDTKSGLKKVKDSKPPLKIEKRKRGRPKLSEKDKAKSTKKTKDIPKVTKKPVEAKNPSRKRKLISPIDIKVEKDCSLPPSKKLKVNDLSCNGEIKTPLLPVHKPWIQKGNSPIVVEHTYSNAAKKPLFFGPKKTSLMRDGPPLQTLATPKNTAPMTNGWAYKPPTQNHQNSTSTFKMATVKKEIEEERPEIKVEESPPPRPEPFKSHPQRMASLDAMAKMHVICTTDRKAPVYPCGHSKTMCHLGIKKEASETKETNVVRKQINYVKEKQQVVVSRSVEQSSVVKREGQSTKSEKKKSKASDSKVAEVKSKPKSQKTAAPSKPDNKSKRSKSKDAEKKSKVPTSKASKPAKKPAKEKPEATKSKKCKKMEQTKSEVKVKETIRMQKTCTYKSVTTVNSETSNSSVAPVSHVGLTTNISKTKKTVVTDQDSSNKVSYSSANLSNSDSYCLSTDSQCTIGHHSECCKYLAHSPPQLIPYAHLQACSLSLPRPSDASTSAQPHCDANFSVHRFGHQQQILYSPHPSDCGCCCSGSLVQAVHEPCLLRKGIVAYSGHHHIPQYSGDSLCADCRPSTSNVDGSGQHFSLPSSSRLNYCTCCELHREPSKHHHQSTGSCLQYLSSPKNPSNLGPCEQSPLDLSLTSASSSSSQDPQKSHCPNSICCRDLVLVRASTPRGYQKFMPNKSCCKCSKPINNHPMEALQQQLHRNQKERLPMVASATMGRGAVLGSVVTPSSSGVSTQGVVHILTDNFLFPATKREKSLSPKQPPKLQIKRRKFAHGWQWEGEPREKLITLTNDSVPCIRKCYPAVRHNKEGDIIRERDCVLLKSGSRDTDLPYVAKIAAFWENPEDGEMMMSLLWYYRPEHTEQGRKPGQMEDEVFASKHRDTNSVACIEDKCYVLTFAEYCRYKANLSMSDDCTISLASALTPELPGGYPRKHRLPSGYVAPDMILFCRSVYDFRQKRILKNPT